MDILKNYIDGVWTPSASQKTVDVVNPATQEVLAKVPAGQDSGKDVEMAVKAASIGLALDGGTGIADTLARHWTADDMTLLCGVVNYWIMDRTLAKRGLA